MNILQPKYAKVGVKRMNILQPKYAKVDEDEWTSYNLNMPR